MKSVSQVIRAIGNAILFIVYVLIANALVGFVLGWIIKPVLGYNIPSEGSAIFDVLAIVTAVVVLLVTLAWRRYFYLSLSNSQTEPGS